MPAQAKGPASPALASPLLQVNADQLGPLPTKFGSSWQELCQNPTLFAGQTPATAARFFQDLFCLRVNAHVLVEHISQLEIEDLLGKYRVSSAAFCDLVEGMSKRTGANRASPGRAAQNNVTQLFTNAVKILKEADKSDIRRVNVVEVSSRDNSALPGADRCPAVPQTLIPFLRNVLARRYSNFSFDVMTLLAGSLERSDSVFTVRSERP